MDLTALKKSWSKRSAATSPSTLAEFRRNMAAPMFVDVARPEVSHSLPKDVGMRKLAHSAEWPAVARTGLYDSESEFECEVDSVGLFRRVPDGDRF